MNDIEQVNSMEQELHSLKNERNQELRNKKEIDGLYRDKIRNLESELEKHYFDYYASKTNKEFILYDDIPKYEWIRFRDEITEYKFWEDYGERVLRSLIGIPSTIEPEYMKYHEKGLKSFWQSGFFNVKELAELVKNCYQLEKNSAYDIITVGAAHTFLQTRETQYRMIFIIGNNETLAPFREHEGLFHNTYDLCFVSPPNKENLTTFQIYGDNKLDKKNPMGIECLTGNAKDVNGLVNYYDYNSNSYCKKSAQEDIHVIKQFYNYIFRIKDPFIVNTLLSIMIYKRNNAIKFLRSKDYKHIFEILYGEKVDIINQTKEDIPKRLIYTPSSIERNHMKNVAKEKEIKKVQGDFEKFQDETGW